MSISQPPVAKKQPHLRNIHGETFIDDYFWLREKDHPEVLAYLKAEEDYATEVMKPFEALEQTLFDEIVSHIAEDDSSVPAKQGEWDYWHTVVRGQNYPIMWRQKRLQGATPEVLLDVNQLAEGKEFLGLGQCEVSADGSRLLYGTDDTGFRQYTLKVRDLSTGSDFPESIPLVTDACWSALNEVLFYVVEDHAKRPWRVYRHVVGTPQAEDVLVFEEADERFSVEVRLTLDGQFIVIHSESKLTSETRIIDAHHPTETPKVLLERRENHEYHVESHHEHWLIRTNDRGSHFRLVAAPKANPTDESLWRELIVHSEETMLEEVAAFSKAIVVAARTNGLPQLRVLVGEEWRTIALPDPTYELDLDHGGNLEFEADSVRYIYQSLATPRTVFAYDFVTGESTRLKEDEVPGGFDRTNYVVERLMAPSHDGVLVPVSVVRRKDLAMEQPHPLHLIAYGSYGISYPVSFSASRLTLLDRGVIYAIAHIRGGGDMGKKWHESARLGTKMNTFLDFIAAAEHLIAKDYTCSDKLTIEGGSAGGMLMGGVTNMRPDLFKAVISLVPFVDCINTMLDDTLPLTVTEYEEWGNPNIAEEYAWIRAYSPYDNLEAKAYPTILVKTSYNDSQVMYWEPAKYVARLRTLKTDNNPLLFKIHLGMAGHGGKSGRYERFHEVAFNQAFLLWQMGLAEAET